MGRPGGRCCNECRALFKIDAESGSIIWTKNLGFDIGAVRQYKDKIYVVPTGDYSLFEYQNTYIDNLYDIIVLDLNGKIIEEECISCFPRYKSDLKFYYQRIFEKEDIEYEIVRSGRYNIRDIVIYEDEDENLYIILISFTGIFQIFNGRVDKVLPLISNDYWIEDNEIVFLSQGRDFYNYYSVDSGYCLQFFDNKISIKIDNTQEFEAYIKSHNYKKGRVFEYYLLAWLDPTSNPKIDIKLIPDLGYYTFEHTNLSIVDDYGGTVEVDMDNQVFTIHFDYNIRDIFYPIDKSYNDPTNSTPAHLDSFKNYNRFDFSQSFFVDNVGENFFNLNDKTIETAKLTDISYTNNGKIWHLGKHPSLPKIHINRLNCITYNINTIEYEPNQSFNQVYSMIDTNEIQNRPGVIQFPGYRLDNLYYGRYGDFYYGYGGHNFYGVGYAWNFITNHFYTARWASMRLDGITPIDFSDMSPFISSTTFNTSIPYYPGDSFNEWLQYYYKDLYEYSDFEDEIVEIKLPKFPKIEIEDSGFINVFNNEALYNIYYVKNGIKKYIAKAFQNLDDGIFLGNIYRNLTIVNVNKIILEINGLLQEFKERFREFCEDVYQDYSNAYSWLPFYAEVLVDGDDYEVLLKTTKFIFTTIAVTYSYFPKKVYLDINNNFIFDALKEDNYGIRARLPENKDLIALDNRAIAKLNGTSLYTISKSYKDKNSNRRVINSLILGDWGIYYYSMLPSLYENRFWRASLSNNKMLTGRYQTETKVMIYLNDNNTYDLVNDDIYDYKDYRHDIDILYNSYYLGFARYHYYYYFNNYLYTNWNRYVSYSEGWLYYVFGGREFFYPSPSRTHYHKLQFRDFDYSFIDRPYFPQRLVKTTYTPFILNDNGIKYDLSRYNNTTLNHNPKEVVLSHNDNIECIAGYFNDGHENMVFNDIHIANMELDNGTFIDKNTKQTFITYNYTGKTNGDFIFRLTRRDGTYINLDCNINTTTCSEIVDFINANGCIANIVRDGTLHDVKCIVFAWRDVKINRDLSSGDRTSLSIYKAPYEDSCSHIYGFRDGELIWKNKLFMEPRILTDFIDKDYGEDIPYYRENRVFNSYYGHYAAVNAPAILCVNTNNDFIYVGTSYHKIISRDFDNSEVKLLTSYNELSKHCDDYKNKELLPYIDFPYKNGEENV